MSRTFIEVEPEMRNRLQQAIEALIDVLDELAPDDDLEDGGDDDNGLGDADGAYEQWGDASDDEWALVSHKPLNYLACQTCCTLVTTCLRPPESAV